MGFSQLVISKPIDGTETPMYEPNVKLAQCAWQRFRLLITLLGFHWIPCCRNFSRRLIRNGASLN